MALMEIIRELPCERLQGKEFAAIRQVFCCPVISYIDTGSIAEIWEPKKTKQELPGLVLSSAN